MRRYGCSLRSFLRYCYLAGLVDRDLSAAVLPVSGRRRSLLPEGITPAQAKALLRACDRRRASGLRHTAAGDMLRAGASLGEIGQVLRQRSPGSTAAYARVDVERLRAIARPWPAGEAS